MAADPEPISQRPVARLIRELLTTGRAATAAEIGAIVERVATAPFHHDTRKIPAGLRGLRVHGRALAEREDSLIAHLAQRVLLDEQWAASVTPVEFMEDLRAAVTDTATRIVIYDRRGGPIAGFFARNAVPTLRRGARPLPWLYVVYAADRGSIISGYQTTSLSEIAIPRGATWLK